MSFYFVGGEDHDFSPIGSCFVNTANTTARRTANARCSLIVAAAAVNDGWQGALTAAVSDFWFTARFFNEAVFGTQDWLVFLDGSTRRLLIKLDASGHIIIATRDATPTTTTLATSTLVLGLGVTPHKLDVQVSYGASGSVNVYVDGVLWVSYSGDVTTNSATTLSGFVLGSTSGNGSAVVYWSEIVCGTADTRHMSVITLPPAANGNTFAWSNTYASVDETTINDADLCASSSANDVMQTTVTSSGITGTPAIRAVAVSARAMKGASGPTQIQMNVRTGGSDYFSGTLALETSFGRVSNIWETNPNTTAAWLYTAPTAVGFNIGAKSIA